MSESIGELFFFIRVHLGAEIVDQKLAYNAKIHVLHQKCARWLEVAKITKMILLRVWGTPCICKKRVKLTNKKSRPLSSSESGSKIGLEC